MPDDSDLILSLESFSIELFLVLKSACIFSLYLFVSNEFFENDRQDLNSKNWFAAARLQVKIMLMVSLFSFSFSF